MALAADTRVAVAITALAFSCMLALSEPVRVRHPPDKLSAMRAEGFDVPVDEDGLTSCRTEGMTTWAPDRSRGDLVRFRGQVLAARQVTWPAPARAAWMLRLRAWRPNVEGEPDWLLDLAFDATVWVEPEPPTAGQEVQGQAWLVGEVLGRVPRPVARAADQAPTKPPHAPAA